MKSFAKSISKVINMVYLVLVARIGCAGVDDYLVDLAETPEILWFLQNFRVGESR